MTGVLLRNNIGTWKQMTNKWHIFQGSKLLPCLANGVARENSYIFMASQANDVWKNGVLYSNAAAYSVIVLGKNQRKSLHCVPKYVQTCLSYSSQWISCILFWLVSTWKMKWLETSSLCITNL